MPNNDHDDLFDAWGQAFNVNPQLVKSVYQMESGSGTTNPRNPMGIQPETAAAVAKKMGWDATSVDVADMRWAVPIAMRVMADGLNATQSAEGALGYYNSGSTDPKKWNPNYIATVQKIYPTATLKPATPAGPQSPQDGVGVTAGATQPPAAQAAPAPQEPVVAPPQQASKPDGSTGEGIVSTAASLTGANGATVVPFLRQNGQSLDATRANWCAAFANAVLHANGVEGTTGPLKNVATSFLNWGVPVEGAPQPGDVLVQPRGHPAGGIGGHVGVATGHVAEGNGKRYYLMQSGNLAGKVAYSWEPAQSVVARRAPQPSQQAAN